jgi:hypothetical protein
LLNADETGMRLCGKLHWMHVASTSFLTYLAWHPKRGRPALEAIGMWPHFQGRAMRLCWTISLCRSPTIRQNAICAWSRVQQKIAGTFRES